ncbi:MAG: FG-GAP repeat domain-containing protein [Myxococcota bacterium]
MMLLLLGGCFDELFGPAASECAAPLPPDGVVVVDATCEGAPTSPSWDLSVRDRTPLPAFATELHATRVEDVDGDGLITAADPMQLWVESGLKHLSLHDADTTWRAEHVVGAYRATAAVGELDPTTPGSEILVAWSEQDPSERVGREYLTLGDEGGVFFERESPSALDNPWLTDLEGDGTIEAIVNGRILDATTGAWLADLEGIPQDVYGVNVTADLDRDGVQEIISRRGNAVDLLNADGSLRNTCRARTAHRSSFMATFAVGNLDGDADGEFVAAGGDFVAVCDTDGTLLTSIELGLSQPSSVAIGELDGDPEPEIVVVDGPAAYALDHDLTLKWTYTGPNWCWFPLSLVDLDNDGLHEVLIHVEQDLKVLSPTGVELAVVDLGNTYSSSWMSQPVVADLDGDGLAEIVVGDDELFVITNADGGWRVPEAEVGWAGMDHFPGDRAVDGSIPPASPFWLESNVWNGHPAGPVGTADLGVAVTDVCVDTCEGDAVVTVAVGNHGVEDLHHAATVEVWSADGGDLLGTTVLAPSLGSGVSRSVAVTVPADRLAEGLAARVSTPVAECDLVTNEAEWRGSVCP